MTAWPTSKLGDLTTVISSGATPLGGSENYTSSGEVIFIRSQNVRMNRLVLDDIAFITRTVDQKLARTRVQTGDTLLNITGASIGRVAVFGLEGVRANVNQHVCVIRPKPQCLSSNFLSRYIATPHFQSHINRIQAGGTRQALNFSQIADFDIPLPPLPEQRKIAAILDQADALRTKRRQILAKLDALAQALFIEVFGDPATNPKSWSRTVLSAACEKISDGTHHSPETLADGVPYITAKHISTKGLDFFSNPWFVSEEAHRAIYSRCDPLRGDVLYIKDGATTGIAALNTYDFPFSMLSSVALLRPRPRKCTSEYLVAWLNHPLVKLQMTGGMSGAAIQRLTLAKLKNANILLPPFELQQQFSEDVTKIQTQSVTCRESDKQFEMLFASLQYRAFRGEL